MFALMSLAEADPPESRSTDIEMNASQLAGAHWVAEFLARRTIEMATPPSEAGETREFCDPIHHAEMAPV
jgi:hypothetical protein